MVWSLVTSPHAHHSGWCHIGRWTASAPGPLIWSLQTGWMKECSSSIRNPGLALFTQIKYRSNSASALIEGSNNCCNKWKAHNYCLDFFYLGFFFAKEAMTTNQSLTFHTCSPELKYSSTSCWVRLTLPAPHHSSWGVQLTELLIKLCESHRLTLCSHTVGEPNFFKEILYSMLNFRKYV